MRLWEWSHPMSRDDTGPTLAVEKARWIRHTRTRHALPAIYRSRFLWRSADSCVEKSSALASVVATVRHPFPARHMPKVSPHAISLGMTGPQVEMPSAAKGFVDQLAMTKPYRPRPRHSDWLADRGAAIAESRPKTTRRKQALMAMSFVEPPATTKRCRPPLRHSERLAGRCAAIAGTHPKTTRPNQARRRTKERMDPTTARDSCRLIVDPALRNALLVTRRKGLGWMKSLSCEHPYESSTAQSA
ncbi:hypothetical protein B0A55_04610 [Friedmanniomyces simplex]|uniref:Uncharacterized protein n=1 Tax=Friedmanniomyces simplex TaxID=329884 RepID=A0A4U0XMT8_9PEZI|nr:hypothetical protein B0A55_04610 [Friedmanniomyces simplex]